MITGIFPTLCTTDVAATRDFYADLFGFRVVFDSGWYVQLEAPDRPNSQIGIVQRDHSTVPREFRQDPAGVILAIEVDDVDSIHRRVTATGRKIPLELRDEDSANGTS